jgi:orotate phosphoribosyltransferase
VSTGDLGAQVVGAMGATWGHFRYESGHHGDLWLDLDPLTADARRLAAWGAALAALLPPADVVVGPFAGGAFLAQAVAVAAGCAVAHAEREVVEGRVVYRVPPGRRAGLDGAPVLVVDDVANAASALAASVDDVVACGGRLVGVGAPVTLGEAAEALARRFRVPFACLARLERRTWSPQACALCAEGTVLEERELRG